jgi:SPP1 gp7 family putative phage head morphogenesis protein
LAAPAISQLKAAATSQPFQGRLLREWYRDLGADTARKVSDAVKIGIIEGQTTDQIVRRIKGTKARQYRDGILEIGRHQAQAIVRTAIAHTSARAQDELYAANADIIEGVKWVSTLDSRTSARCRALDSKVFPVNSGPRPPQHFSCRSRVIAYLGEFKTKGTRASAIGPVPDDMNYSDWLKKQPVAVQNEALGVKKAQLFRKGGMSIDRFADSTGKEYTLDELRVLDSQIWNKVFS